MKGRERFQTSFHWGAYEVEVEDDHVIDIHPFDDDPHPSQIGCSIPLAIEHEARVMQPMIRQGWLEKDSTHSRMPALSMGGDVTP